VGQLGSLPIVYFGAQLWGAEGVLIGQMAGGMFAAIFSFILAERLMKKAKTDQLTKTVDPEFKEHQRSFKIMQHCR
jgi:glycerol uptake facilitator-like aquaporin